MLRELKPAFLMLIVFTVLTGLVYPFVVTGIGQVLFPRQANGSLIERDGKAVGSELIGQPFSSPKYFWSRPSATSPYPYNAASSSGVKSIRSGAISSAFCRASKYTAATASATSYINVPSIHANRCPCRR